MVGLGTASTSHVNVTIWPSMAFIECVPGDICGGTAKANLTYVNDLHALMITVFCSDTMKFGISIKLIPKFPSLYYIMNHIFPCSSVIFPENVGISFPQNDGTHLPNYIATHLRCTIFQNPKEKKYMSIFR
jgi:hypothetical protein